MVVAPYRTVSNDYAAELGGVYHNKNTCPEGKLIPVADRRYGTGNLPLCPECRKVN